MGSCEYCGEDLPDDSPETEVRHFASAHSRSELSAIDARRVEVADYIGDDDSLTPLTLALAAFFLTLIVGIAVAIIV